MRSPGPVLRTMSASAPALTLACAPAIRSTVQEPLTVRQLAELWEDPTDLKTRDLFWGPWDRKLAPPAGQTYRFVEEKTTGFSPGFIRIRSSAHASTAACSP